MESAAASGPLPIELGSGFQRSRRDRSALKKRLVSVAGVPFLLMAIVAAVLLFAIRGLIATERSVERSGEVIARGFDALKPVLDMETGLRGYLLTGDRQFLQPYEAGRQALEPAVERLSVAVRGDAAQSSRVDDVRRLIVDWQSWAEEAVRERASGSAAQIDSIEGKRLMDRIRLQFDVIVQQAQARRADYIASARFARSYTSWLEFGLTVVAGLIVAIFAGHQLRQVSSRYERSLERAAAASREAEQREAQFREIAEALPQIVWACAPDGSPTFFNRRWTEYTGASSSQRDWPEFVAAPDRTSAREQWRASLASGEAFSTELRLLNLSGEPRWHLARALPIRDGDGAIASWLGTFTDIEEQKLAEQSQLRLAAIVESSGDAIFAKTLDGTITTWNRAAKRMYGYTPEEMVGRNVRVLCPPERLAEIDYILERLSNGNSVEQMETVRLRKDGAPVEVSLTISPIRDADGTITGASTIARDITQAKRANDALRKTEKLAATGRLAGSMAHEINNPLEAVTHLLYLLEHHPSLDDKAREYAHVASDEIGRVGHIARQALGFYREAPSPVDVRIGSLIADVVELYNAAARNKGVILTADILTETAVPAFPGEMRQVFSNLIVNAVDAVGRGGNVKIRVREGCEWKAQRRGICVIVADNGPGIPAEIRPHIFEPFFTTKGEKGTGVGLWVSDGVIRKHGGTLRLRSRVGERSGTSFLVFIPYQPAAQSA